MGWGENKCTGYSQVTSYEGSNGEGDMLSAKCVQAKTD